MNHRTRSASRSARRPALPATAAALLVAALTSWANPAAADQPDPKAPPTTTMGTSTPGAVGPAAVVSGRIEAQASATVAPHKQGHATAMCPIGTKVVGGGGETFANAGYLNTSIPLGDGSGWVAYLNNTTASSMEVDALAICASNIPKYQIVTGDAVDNPAKTQVTATVTCPTGTVPYGGGGTASSLAVQVNLNSDLWQGNGWRVDVNNNGSGSDTATSTVVCGGKPLGYQKVLHQGGTNVPANTPGNAGDLVDCPTGTAALGGGAYSDSSARTVNLTQLYTLHSDGQTWTSQLNNRSTRATTITSYAVCAQTS